MTQPVPTRFFAAAERLPDKDCIVQGATRTSYGELAARARAAGAWLTTRIAPGERVAALMDNCAEYVVTCYGTWCANGVLVPLSVALRADEVIRAVRHSGASVLVADPQHDELEQLRAQLEPDVEILETGCGQTRAWSDASVGRPERTVSPDDLASIGYTSGTTGEPKGVMLSHANLATNADAICAYLEIDENDKALCVLPFHYSYGASVLHTHLTRGATVVLENSLMYPHAVLERIGAEKVTSLAGVPSTFYLLLRAGDLGRYDLTSLRYVTQAGGMMPPHRIAEFREALPTADFVVMYGQTEATARLTYVPPDQLDLKTGSVGRPIPGVTLRVTDEHGEALAPGDVGEVTARGPGVMMGYWQDSEATRRVLRDGWLHTGDVGVLDEDGYLYLRGRSREMIKMGAHRIAPAEIEEVIRTVAGVEDVAVVGMEDDILGEAVRACVVASPDAPAGLERRIRRRCLERLARFKMPKAVDLYDELPRTSSGKIRKHSL